MSSTNFAKNQSQNFNFGGISYTPPNTYWLALSTTTVSSTGSNCTEPVGAAYARVQIPNTKSYFTYASSGCLVLSAPLAYTQSSGSWGTIVDLALFDTAGSSSGSMWYYTSLASPKIVQSDTIVSFSASSISISQT